MNDGLSHHDAELRTGEEPFRGQNVRPALQLIDYWRWSGSMLSDNTTRGDLAEFLVAAALGLHKNIKRAWDVCDIRMPSNTSIEVKSAAYNQAWKQARPSTIRFGVAPSGSWNAETGKFNEEKSAGLTSMFSACLREGILLTALT